MFTSMCSDCINRRRMPAKPVLDLNVAERFILRTIDVEEADMDLRETYGIGEVSKIAGVSTRTLRFYEEEGLSLIHI